MWHFILPFTNKHHADCHLRKLSCLWKSEDVGMIILMGDESSLCCWCVIRKTIPAKKLYQPQVLGIGHPWSYVTSHSIGKYHVYNGYTSTQPLLNIKPVGLKGVVHFKKKQKTKKQKTFADNLLTPMSSKMSMSLFLQRNLGF